MAEKRSPLAAKFKAAIKTTYDGVREYPFEHKDLSALLGHPDAPAFFLGEARAPEIRRRWYAICGLADLGAPSPEVVDLLADLLAHPHGLLRRHARWALHRLSPDSLPFLLDRAVQNPGERLAIADAIGFAGRAASGVSDRLRAMKDGSPTDPAIDAALREIHGPWDANPETPVPYLGEQAIFGESPDIGDVPRARYEAGVWCELANRLAMDAAEDDMEVLDLDGWTPEMEESFGRRLDLWRPARVVVARPKLTLTDYDWAINGTISKEIHSDDGAVFTMGELLHKAQAFHESNPNNGGYRYFEGLRKYNENPGEWHINTGS